MVLVRSFEMLDGKKMLVAEGDIPDNQVQGLKTGVLLNITRTTPAISQVGATKPIVKGEIVIGQYEITNIQQVQTEINTPAIEIMVKQIW